MDLSHTVTLLLGFSLFILCTCMCTLCTHACGVEDNLVCHLSDAANLVFGDRVFLTGLELIK